MKHLILAALLALTFAAAWADQASVAKLREGEVVLEYVRTSESGGAARARMRVEGEAAAEAMWAIIVSCPMAFVYVQGLERCEVLEDTGDRAVVHQVVDPSWLVPAQDFVFESLRDPYRQIRFSLLEGNIDVLEGFWQFTPLEGGVLVDYEMRVKPAMPAPRFLVRRIVRRGMPDLLACVRGLAGGSRSESARQADLARCPGELPAGIQ